MHVDRWSKKWGTSSEKDYLEKVLEHSKGENGVWGIKVMRLYWKNFTNLLQRAIGTEDLSNIELLNACFPNLHFIWMTRRDKVRQAISWLKFVQGAAWYWEDEKPQELEGLEFKPDVISEFISQTAIHETAWLSFFRDLDVQPYIVVFEDFVNAYKETAKEILRYLEIPYPEKLVFG